MRAVFNWTLATRALELGKRTLIMGVVNTTPDSFSDGGKFLDRDQAVKHAACLLEDGADIIDIGGESTRPGARVDAGPPSRQASEITRVGADAFVRPASEASVLMRAVPMWLG